MAKAKEKKVDLLIERIAKRFPQLAADRHEQIAQYEGEGWIFEFDETKSWNAEHPKLAPDWKPHYGNLDGLISHINRVLTGGPLDEKPAVAKPQAPSTNDTAVGRMIVRSLLRPSPTNPRKRFPKDSITELAQSIREQGVLEPLIVRDAGTGYEIVCGERRFRAATEAGLDELPCIVRDLTDDQVLDIQIHENLHREDVHPLDEALGYKFLQDKLKCDVHELSVRVGKPESYVINRLKLNNLIPAAMKDLEANILPLGHALEIAKFTDRKTQEAVRQACFQPSWQGGGARPLKQVLVEINRTYLLQLSKAPFNIKAIDLRKDHLACGECSDRTGATPGLFANYEAAKTDNCLNKSCYEGKIEQHFQNRRAILAVDLNVDAKDVPVVNFDSYGQGGKILGYYDVTKATKKNANAKGVLVGISAAAHNYGQVVYFRKKARPKSKSSSNGSAKNTGGEKSPAEKEQFYKRKEEIWQSSVGEEVRKRVFAQAAAKFAKQFSVSGAGDNFVAAMAVKLADLYNNDYTKRRIRDHVVRPIVAASIDVEQNTVLFTESYVAVLPANVQGEMLYLLIHGDKGDMSDGYWGSQKPVLDIAAEWKIDYRLIDAKVRVEKSAKKHMEVHKTYLLAVENDKPAAFPRIYSEKWEPKD